MRQTRVRISSAVAAATMLFTLAACAPSNPSPESSSGGAGKAAIKIGFALAQSGFGAGMNVPAGKVAEAWAKSVNAKGGIDGHPVEVVLRDTAGNPATGLTAVKELVEKEHVVAMMTLDPASESTFKDYLVHADVAVIDVHAYDSSMFGVLPNFNTISTSQKYAFTGLALSAAADSGGKGSIGLATCVEVAACADQGRVTEALAGGLGMHYSGMVLASASQPNYTAECLNFIQKGTDYIALGFDDVTTQRFANDCLQQGFKGKFAMTGQSAVAATFDGVPGGRFVGMMLSFPWWVQDEPVVQFRDAVAKYAPDTAIAGANQTNVWTSLEMFRKAVTGSAANGLTREQMIKAFGTIQDQTLNGLMAQAISYTPGKPAPLNSCFWLYSYVGGQFVTVQKGPIGNKVNTSLASSCYDGPPLQ